jgi:hypothetical protein
VAGSENAAAVLGAREATIHLIDAAVAHGFAAAIPDRLGVIVGNGRGERGCADTFQLSVRIVGGSLGSAQVERSA